MLKSQDMNNAVNLIKTDFSQEMSSHFAYPPVLMPLQMYVKGVLTISIDSDLSISALDMELIPGFKAVCLD